MPTREHPEETAEFIDYYFSPETQARLLVEVRPRAGAGQISKEDLTGLDPR